MRTARRETTFRSKGCSLKSDEFVAMRKLRRESEIEWKRSKGQSVGPSQVEKRKKSDFLLMLPRSRHLHRDWNDREELLVACKLASVVDLLPKGEVVVLSLVVVHGGSLLPVKQIKGDLKDREEEELSSQSLNCDHEPSPARVSSLWLCRKGFLAQLARKETYRVVYKVDIRPG